MEITSRFSHACKSLILFNFNFMYKMYNWRGENDSSNVSLLSPGYSKESFRLRVQLTDPKDLRREGNGIN